LPLFQQGRILGERKGPILSTLSERRTIVLKEPLVRRLGLNPLGFLGQPRIPEGVTEEQAVKVMSTCAWARGWAEGMAKLTGYTPGTAEYSAAVDRLALFLARRTLGVG